jgi:hypothetical protein
MVQAITAFEALVQRLEAMAEAKRPPWWGWLRFRRLKASEA